MDLKYCCDCNIYLVIGVLTFMFCVSCSTSKEAQTPQVPVEDLPRILREASGPRVDTTRNDTKDDVTLSYKNKSTSVTIPIDPYRQDFILELKGLKRTNNAEEAEAQAQEDEQRQDNKKQMRNTGTPRPDSTIMQDSLVQANMAKKIKQVLKDFRRAQDLFYREDYKGALEMVNRSLETQPTADGLGLKGTIFFMRDNMTSAKYYWNRAVQMDPEILVPDIPELDSFIRDIKAEDPEEEEE